MDFLIIFLLYVFLILLSILFCIFSGRKHSFPSRVVAWGTRTEEPKTLYPFPIWEVPQPMCAYQVHVFGKFSVWGSIQSYQTPLQPENTVQKLVPLLICSFEELGLDVLLRIVPARVLKVLHGLFHTRSCLFVVLNFVLKLLVYGEYSWEVFGYCKELEFHILFLLLPYLLLFVNMGFFILCSKSNPGTITKSNQALFLDVYAYDGVMFKKDTKCSTCSVRKPARSKHCSVCNSCVHRFDHHCVWINNCIGAFNMRYFLIYLLTLMTMAAAIIVVTATFLVRVVVLSDMMLGHYMDDQSQEHPVDVAFLIQYLFLTFPRIVFMLGFVIVVSMILGSFFCFTLYLILTNQTLNEWFKSASYKCSCSQPCSRHGGYKNVYSRGVWGNLMEIMRPLMNTGKKR